MSADRNPDDGRIVAQCQGDVLLITIDRPKKLNGFSAVMLDELSAAYSAMERDPNVRCGLLCAEGKNFTAGLELNRLSQRFAEGKPLFPDEEVDPVNLRRLRTKPLVVAVHGICFTIGIELMLAADVVIAASDCRFAQLEVQRGIMASAGATIRMAERAGLGNALRYLLTGEEFDAQTALRLGFVQEVVAPEELRTRATALAKLIAAQAPLAVSKRSRLTPPSLGRSIAWLADRRRDPTPINSRKKRKSSVIAAFTPKAVLKRKVRAYLRKTIST